MRFSTHVQWRDEKFGAVLFDTLSEKVYVTNETGRDILPLIEKGLDAGEIVDGLMTDYQAEPDRIRADVNAFLAELRSAKLVADGRGGGA